MRSELQDSIRMPEKFAAINRMVLRDLNHRTSKQGFFLYSKDDIQRFLRNPSCFERQLRSAVIYLYGASAHFRRLIQYFTSLSDLSYVVSPYRTDTSTTSTNTKRVRNSYRKVLNLMSSMDVKNSFEKILTVCFREDVFFGTIREGADSTLIQQLPPDYCEIAVIEDNVLNVSFDFAYFDSYPYNLRFYPEEFKQKYELYKEHKAEMRWQMLDAPNSFAIKCNKEILHYAMPPFAGILREIYDIEDYKQLKMTKAEIENYALLVMTIPLNSDGSWGIDLDKAKGFWKNLDDVMPEEIGSVLTPMPIEKISFERTHTGDTDTIAEAEQNLYTSAGVSSLLFNNAKASANALALSIKVDQAMTYSVVKSIECMVNRYIHRKTYGKNFKVTFLDCSPFNRKEVGDAYLKAAQFGLPTISFYAASQGMSPEDVDGMNFLEDTVLKLKEKLTPLQSSATMSSTGNDPGRPESDPEDLTEDGEATRERGET